MRELGSQRVAWQVLLQGNASVVNAVRRQDGGWDASRFVPLRESSEPEHCRRVQIVVGKLPGLPGNRTWSFGGWRSKQGMGQMEGKGDEAPSAGRCPTIVRSGHGSAGQGDMEMWGVLPRTGAVGPGSSPQARGLTNG